MEIPPPSDDWDLKPTVEAMPQNIVDQLSSLTWPAEGLDSFEVVVSQLVGE